MNLTPTFSPVTNAITNLPTNGGGTFGCGALNAVRPARTVQLGAKLTFQAEVRTDGVLLRL